MSDQGATQQPPVPQAENRVLLRGKVVKLVREGQFDEALGIVSSVMAKESEPAQETLLWRAGVYAKWGRYAEALADADAALVLPGNDAIGAHKMRAQALRALGRMDEAQQADVEMGKLAKPSPMAQKAFWSFIEGGIVGVRKRDVSYSVGNAHSPGDSVGRDEFRVGEDEHFELRNQRQSVTRVWRGRLRAGVFQEIEDRIKASTFPQLPTRPPVAGAALRELTYQGRCALLPFHEPGLRPEDHALFAAMDQLVDQIKAGVPTSDIAEVTMEGPTIAQ